MIGKPDPALFARGLVYPPHSLLPIMNPYETQRLLAEYLLFHYGNEDEILPSPAPAGMREALGFPVRTVSHFSPTAVARGLDLGCAVGRSTYEMSRSCRETMGIDFSQRFIQAASDLSRSPLPYQRQDEGYLTTRLEASLPVGLHPTSVTFETGDAMALREDLGTFDRVHAANLLCRLTDPVKLLERLPRLVRPGGELVLATPCTWLADFTPPEHWPDGRTFDWLRSHLDPHFQLQSTTDEPFLIRETARKFQWTTSLVTVWRRN